MILNVCFTKRILFRYPLLCKKFSPQSQKSGSDLIIIFPPVKQTFVFFFGEDVFQFLFFLIRHDDIYAVSKAEARVEYTPPVSAFCFPDADSQCLISSCRKGAVPIGFHRKITLFQIYTHWISIASFLNLLFCHKTDRFLIFCDTFFCFLNIFCSVQNVFHIIYQPVFDFQFQFLVFFAVAVCQHMKTQDFLCDPLLDLICCLFCCLFLYSMGAL